MEKFWSKVQKSEGCWTWNGSRDPRGYGRIYLNAAERVPFAAPGSTCLTHRVSWVMHFGAIPDGLCVCHRCDNPTCVRPDHLFLGTRAENSEDAARKGRMARVVPDAEVSQIRLLAQRGIPQSVIVRMYGLDSSTVSRIVNGKRRVHRVEDIGDGGLPALPAPAPATEPTSRRRSPPRLSI